MYDNIKIMLRQTSRIGFGCRSDTGRFSIDKQKYIFDDDLIYRIDTDEVYYYDFNTGRWVRIGRVQDYIPGRTYLYNPRTNHLYFYNHVDNYCVLQ
jgi:NDP-sugar pyrophosphorylase family protein